MSSGPRGKRRENKGSNRNTNSANNELGLEPNSGQEMSKKSLTQWSGKTFNTLHGLRIHQDKVCQKKGLSASQVDRTQDEWPVLTKVRSNPQPSLNSLGHTMENGNPSSSGQMQRTRKANYKQFDIKVFKIVSRCKGSTEQKLKRLAEIVYEKDKKRFGKRKGGGRRSHELKSDRRK